MSVNRQIIDRFFEALAHVEKNGEITGIGDFCETHGFNRVRYLNVKNHPNHPGYKTIEVEAIYCLAKYYDISAEWVITGRGSMKLH